MTNPQWIRKLTDAQLERLASHDRTPPEARQALIDEEEWRAIAAQEALRYPTFEAYNDARNEALRRSIQESGQRFCGNYLRSAYVARKAFYERTWAGKR